MRAYPSGFVVLVGCCALGLAACQPRSETAVDAVAPATVGAAQRIVLDPAAAAIAPAALEPVASTNEPAAEVHLPDGTVGVRVAKRYYHTISVCRQADGSFSSDCPAVTAP